VRLAPPEGGKWQAVQELLDTNNDGLVWGACEALRELRLIPPRELIERLIDFARRFPLDENQVVNQWFAVAAAAPGWLEQSPAVRPFLETCMTSKNYQVTMAASAALEGRYVKWG